MTNPEKRGSRWRCMHESWTKYGRIRENVRRCKNFTTNESGLCWRHQPVPKTQEGS